MHTLHIIPNTVFANPFISFVNRNFSAKSHVFLVYGKNDLHRSLISENVLEIRKSFSSFLYLTKMLYKSDKIICHGLFGWHIVVLLFIQPWLLRKAYWVIWGGDLYYHKTRGKSLALNIYDDYLRKRVIKRMYGLITHVRGDYELAQKWYGAKGKYFYCFMYPSNLYNETQIEISNAVEESIYIQVGNSADPSNNHFEVLSKLHKFKNKDIIIICPLSYGDKEYAKEIIKYGKENFGHKFMPITDFLGFEDYLKLLNKIDIAIFNHRRQQALGNIITLIGLGKKVLIRSDITTWDFCIQHELTVYDANKSYDRLFDEMDAVNKERNIERIKHHFTEEKLISDWRQIFNA